MNGSQPFELSRRFGEEHRRRRQLAKENEAKNRERMLYSLKETPMPKIIPNISTAKGLNCTTCVTTKANKLAYEIHLRRHLVNALEEESKYPKNVSWSLKCFGWFIHKFLPKAVTSLLIHPGQLEIIKNVHKKHPGAPIIFLLNNKSFMDHLLMKFVLVSNGVASPLLVIEDELNSVRGVGFLMRKLGINSNNEKLHENLLKGENLQIFLQGGNGPAQLRTVVNLVEDGSIPEVLLVPVSVAYEKENVQELAEGQFSALPTFSSVYRRIWDTLKLHFGIIRLNFNEPYTATQWINTLKARDIQTEPSKQITQHAFQDNQQTSVLMSTNVVAFLLLNRFTHGATKEELTTSLNSLRESLRREYCFKENSEKVVQHALKLFGPNLIIQQQLEKEIVYRPNLKLPFVAELVSYAKPIRAHYALQSVVAASARHLFNSLGYLRNMELVKVSGEFCDLLSAEFVLCKPCQDLEYLINDAINELVMKEILIVKARSYTDDEQRARRYAQHLEDDERFSDGNGEEERPAQMDESELVEINTDKHEEMSNLIILLSPVLLTYQGVAECLFNLMDALSMSENAFLTLCMKTLSNSVVAGTCEFAESISLESVKCCLEIFIKWEIVEVSYTNDTKMVSLSSRFQTVKSLEVVFEQIDRFVHFH